MVRGGCRGGEERCTTGGTQRGAVSHEGEGNLPKGGIGRRKGEKLKVQTERILTGGATQPESSCTGKNGKERRPGDKVYATLLYEDWGTRQKKGDAFPGPELARATFPSIKESAVGKPERGQNQRNRSRFTQKVRVYGSEKEGWMEKVAGENHSGLCGLQIREN